MFKPGLRSISRSIPRQHVSNSGAACRRSLFTRHTQRPITATATVGRNTTAITTAVLVGGFLAYQLSTEPLVQAEAPSPVTTAEDLKSRLSVQHVQVCVVLLEVAMEILTRHYLQVKNSWENPGVYAWGNNVYAHLAQPFEAR